MSVIKRRMELQEEFSSIKHDERHGRDGLLSRQFLRTLPVMCSPLYSKRNIITVGEILANLRDVLRHVAESVCGGLPFKDNSEHLIWEVELSVAHPVTLATFNFRLDRSIETNEDVFENRLFAELDGFHFFPQVEKPVITFIKMMDSFPGGAFWRDWYQGFLDGKPLDWELQRRVALIPDEDWEKGPAHVAEIIEEIRARFELQRRVEELEAELASASRSRLGIGGNLPPEPIDDAHPLAKEFTIVWAPLQDLKKEVEAEDPDNARIQRIIEALVKALKAGLAWCAKKGDLAVDTIIKWAVPAVGGGYFALNPDKLAAVIEAAKSWLSALP